MVRVAMGSRRADDFGQEYFRPVSAIGDQIALAVDNAIDIGHVTEAGIAWKKARLYPGIGDSLRI